MIPIYHDGNNSTVEIQVVGIERPVELTQAIDAIHLVAKMPPNGLFSNRGPIDVWLSNDSARVPVLIKTKIVVGYVVARLVSRMSASKEHHEPSAMPQTEARGNF